jgi:alginate O-acetyltransferase complex protein AlgI
LASTAYMLQIYFDFAGYSNMAIGLGLMMGFHLPQNFDYPYVSRSITEFWRRWHITLSSWFRDYLYIPLGGNRRGALKTYRNLMSVFLLCGLWHGAAWTFIVWGAYHGCFLVFERLGLSSALERGPRALSHLYTLLVVGAGWVIFRSDSLAQAAGHFSALVGLGQGDGVAHPIGLYLQPDAVLALAIGAFAAVPTLPWIAGRISGRASRGIARPMTGAPRFALQAATLVGLLAILLVSSMKLAAGTHNPFIYFRF